MSEAAKNNEVVASAEAYLRERQQWMSDAVELFTGDPEADPLQVFIPASEVRADGLPTIKVAGQERGISPDEEPRLREIAGHFGIGGERDVKSQAEFAVIEGGKIWKVEAEIAISDTAEALVLAGSSHRIVGQDEVDYARSKYGIEVDQKSEYDMERALISQYADFTAEAQEEVLPFGYEVAEENPLVQEPTGQLVKIGTKAGKPVYHLRVDRENYVDEEGKNKYRHQPDSARLLQLVTEAMDGVSVGIITSNTYASRAIDVVRAGLMRQAHFDVGMYGVHTIAEVKSEDPASQPELKQIPGEMHTIASKLAKLEAELSAY